MNNFKEMLGENVHNLPDYEFRALRYAETYGIITYQVHGNKMVWSELHQVAIGEYFNYIYELDLDTFETKVQKPEKEKEDNFER